jgi:dephospho-CoA kinase
MIIGITGTIGAGKGTVVEYLIQKGFKHYSVRAFLTEEIQKRGLPVDRNSMRAVANDLRATRDPAYVIETLYARATEAGGNAIVESVRTLKETEFLKQKGARLLAVDADRKLRYERAVLRGSETDKVTFEEFCAQEDREMNATAEWDMNIAGVMKQVDSIVYNNGTLEELHVQVDGILATLKA